MTVKPSSKTLASLQGAVAAQRPLIYVQSHEEERIARLLAELAAGMNPSPPVYTWSVTESLQGGGVRAKGLDSPRAILDHIFKHDGPGLFLLKDFHEYLEAPEIRRRLRDLYTELMRSPTGKFVVITSPLLVLPEDLVHEVMLIQLTVPDLSELEEIIDEEAGHTGAGVSEGDRYLLGRALQGLAFNEARHALRRGVSETAGRLDASIVPMLQEEKRQLVRKAGLIEYVAEGVTLDHVGGLGNLKKWLQQRKQLFMDRDTLAAEIVPKGILLMGVSGCGKSLSVKAIASIFELPLYRIDMIDVFSNAHGNPEKAFTDACRLMEQVSPAVVWFDEIEMGVSAQDSSGASGRIFAYFLTWMQEKPKGLFVAATANRIDLLPAEMIRKGRFDQVFFIDLPTDQEKLAIFEIHLRQRRVNLNTVDPRKLIKFTEGWNGAEVEQCVIAAVTAAHLESRSVNDNDLMFAAREIVPISRTMKEQVNHIRSWAFDRALRASPKA
jgi:SpoVK/Ycf46/Vps4 family AAA+-type ATPase